MGQALLDYNTSLTAEERQFAEEHHDLIYKFLSLYRYNVSEYYDVAALGYLKAVRKYLGVENLRQYSFTTISFKTMHNSVFNSLRSDYRKTKNNIYDHSCGDETNSVIDNIPDCSDGYKTIYDSEEIENIFAVLSDAEKKIFILKSEGYTYSEIAAMMGYKSVGILTNEIYKARQRIRRISADGEIKNGLESDNMGNRGGVLPIIDYGKMKTLYEQGFCDKDIAEKANCSRRAVYQWRKNNNLPLNKRNNKTVSETPKPEKASVPPEHKAMTTVEHKPVYIEAFSSIIVSAFSQINAVIDTVREDNPPEVTDNYKALIKTIFNRALDEDFDGLIKCKNKNR